MKWFYVVLIATLTAAVALAVDRLTHTFRSAPIQAVVAASLIIIFIVFFGFLPKSKE